MKINFNSRTLIFAIEQKSDDLFDSYEYWGLDEEDYSEAVVDSNGLVPFKCQMTAESPLRCGRADKNKNIIFMSMAISIPDKLKLYLCREKNIELFYADSHGFMIHINNMYHTLGEIEAVCRPVALKHFISLYENIPSEYLFRKLLCTMNS